MFLIYNAILYCLVNIFLQFISKYWGCDDNNFSIFYSENSLLLQFSVTINDVGFDFEYEQLSKYYLKHFIYVLSRHHNLVEGLRNLRWMIKYQNMSHSIPQNFLKLDKTVWTVTLKSRLNCNLKNRLNCNFEKPSEL